VIGPGGVRASRGVVVGPRRRVEEDKGEGGRGLGRATGGRRAGLVAEDAGLLA